MSTFISQRRNLSICSMKHATIVMIMLKDSLLTLFVLSLLRWKNSFNSYDCTVTGLIQRINNLALVLVV